MNTENRQKIEKEIAQAAASGLINAGFKVAVFDGEEITLKPTTHVESILEAMFTSDEDYMFVHSSDTGERVGFVRFIYGNDGWDVINDYSVCLEQALAQADKLAESYS